MSEPKTAVRKLTLELPIIDVERLELVCRARRESGVYTPRSCSATQVIKDGLELIYLHEVMGESINNGSDPAF